MGAGGEPWGAQLLLPARMDSYGKYLRVKYDCGPRTCAMDKDKRKLTYIIVTYTCMIW